MPKPDRIPATASDIAKGWPRPYYVGPRTHSGDHDGPDRVNFVQYITAVANEQIFHCSDKRSDEVYRDWLCSCCADPLTVGWVFANREHQASALCARCLIFSLKACPHFADLYAKLGEDWAVVRITSNKGLLYEPDDYGQVFPIKDSPHVQYGLTVADVRAHMKEQSVSS